MDRFGNVTISKMNNEYNDEGYFQENLDRSSYTDSTEDDDEDEDEGG